MKTKIQDGNTDNLINIFKELNYRIIYNTGATIYGVYQVGINFIQVAVCLDIDLIDIHTEYNGNKKDEYIEIPLDMTKKDLRELLNNIKSNIEG